MINILTTYDVNGIRQALSAHPGLANEGIPYDDVNTTKAHPLHRICDGVFRKIIRKKKPLNWQRYFWSTGRTLMATA
ncbi:hypothetical protein [Larkinella arboricola]|nr:hypothetical protein [Larkinella arboricola]